MLRRNLKKLSKEDIRAIKNIKTEARKLFGRNLISVIVYGSRVEGRAKKESDLDIFLLVKERPSLVSKESTELSKIAYNILQKYDIYPSIVVYGEKEFHKLEGTPYVYWLKKAGVLV